MLTQGQILSVLHRTGHLDLTLTVPNEGQPDFALCSHMGMVHIDVIKYGLVPVLWAV